jgi:hypothetical protein
VTNPWPNPFVERSASRSAIDCVLGCASPVSPLSSPAPVRPPTCRSVNGFAVAAACLLYSLYRLCGVAAPGLLSRDLQEQQDRLRSAPGFEPGSESEESEGGSGNLHQPPRLEHRGHQLRAEERLVRGLARE